MASEIELASPWGVAPSIRPASDGKLVKTWLLAGEPLMLILEMDLRQPDRIAWVTAKAVEPCCNKQAALAGTACAVTGSFHARRHTPTFELGEMTDGNRGWWLTPDFEECRAFLEDSLAPSVRDPLEAYLHSHRQIEHVWSTRDALGPQIQAYWSQHEARP